jgi:hypothetical protein
VSAAALAVLLFVLAALSKSRRLQGVGATLGLGYLVTTGQVFLVLGYLLGLTVEAEDLARITPGLTPLITFVAGWIGFSVGIAFHGRVLRPIPRRAFVVALTPALVTAALVSASGWLAMHLLGVTWPESVAAALVLGGAAAASSPTLAAAIRRRRGGRSRTLAPTLRLLQFTAGLTNAVTIAFAAAGFAVFAYGFGELPPMIWLGATIAVGVATGVATWLFLGGPSSDDERLLLGIAMIAFGAGIGTWLRLSPTAISAIAGAVLVNLPGDSSELFRRTLQRIERPAVVILMTVIGVYIAGVASWLVLALLGLMSVARAYILIVTARRVGRAMPLSAGMSADADWAFGLVPQGVLGLVIALGFMRAWQTPHAVEVLAAVALGSIVNELAATRAMREALGLGARKSTTNAETEDRATRGGAGGPAVTTGTRENE